MNTRDKVREAYPKATGRRIGKRYVVRHAAYGVVLADEPTSAHAWKTAARNVDKVRKGEPFCVIRILQRLRMPKGAKVGPIMHMESSIPEPYTHPKKRK